MAEATPGPLTVPAAVAADLARMAVSARPAESCGVVLGTAAAVAGVVPITNRAVGEGAFVLDPDELLSVLVAADAGGDEVVGTYHSHPSGPAIPSSADRAGAVPGWTLLIVAADGTLRAWWPTRVGFVERPVVGS